MNRTRRDLGVAMVVLLLAAGCASGPSSAGVPAPAESSTPQPSTPVSLVASEDGLGDWALGDPTDASVQAMTAALGEPDVDTGWEELRRIEGQDGWYVDDDPISPTWDHRLFRAVCWQALCTLHGGDAEADAGFRGWTLSIWGRWGGGQVDPAEPAVTLAGSGIGLGDTWSDFRAAYPHARPGGGEGPEPGCC